MSQLVSPVQKPVLPDSGRIGKVFSSESRAEKDARLEGIYQALMGEKAELLDQISQYLNDINDIGARTDSLAHDLPEAVIKANDESNGRPSKFSLAIRHSVADSLQIISKTDKSFLTEVLSPIIGSATAKYFSDTSKQLMELVDRKIRLLTSPKTLVWFGQSLFSSKSFTEILNEKTSGYEVESIYVLECDSFEPLALSDRDDGLRSLSILRDHNTADYRSIREYLEQARISGRPSQTTNLSLGVGRKAVILEGGSHILVGIVGGAVCPEIIEQLQFVCDSVDSQFGESISRLGDLEVISNEEIEAKTEGIEDSLQYGLIEKNCGAGKEFRVGAKPIFSLFFVALLFLIGWQGYKEYQWQNYITALEAVPGIAVTQAKKGWGSKIVRGIRDPRTIDPSALAPEFGVNPKQIQFSF
ncbi:MAG: hypothetical protein AAF226_16515, partial [Verrucomicrobiota bacterium]